MAALLAPALLSGCGGVHDLGEEGGALAAVAGEWSGDLSRHLPDGRTLGDVELRAGLLWATLPEPEPYCQQHGNPLLPGAGPVPEVARLGCPDLLGVAPGLVGPSVEIDPQDGSFEVPLLHLPSAEVMVGEVSARVAYASLLLYDDVNGNGSLDLVERPRRPQRHDGEGGPGSGQDRRARPREWSKADPETSDVIYAASFVTMAQPHQRLAFREGGFAISFFYPMLGCDPPPQGFSVVDVAGPVFQAVCAAAALTEAAPRLSISAPGKLASLRCQQPRGQLGVRPDAEPNPAWPRHCANRQELVTVDPDAECPGIIQFTLKGCPGDPECRQPDWNLCGDPPAWWPCTEADDPPPEASPGGGRGGP